MVYSSKNLVHTLFYDKPNTSECKMVYSSKNLVHTLFYDKPNTSECLWNQNRNN